MTFIFTLYLKFYKLLELVSLGWFNILTESKNQKELIKYNYYSLIVDKIVSKRINGNLIHFMNFSINNLKMRNRLKKI